jgi:hypothetical protein
MKTIECPLSPSQLHLWKSQVISPDSPLFNQVSTAALPTTVFTDADAQCMCQAWENLQRIHPAFTIRIVDDGNGNPAQRFNGATIPMAQYNISAQPSDEDVCLQEWVQARSQISFTLSEALVDVALLRLGANRIVIYLNMHHLIADALSTVIIWRTLFSEFTRLRNCIDENQPAPQCADQTSPTNTFMEYVQQLSASASLAKFEQLQGSRTNPAQLPLPGFYDQLPGRPTTRSTRLPVELSDS